MSLRNARLALASTIQAHVPSAAVVYPHPVAVIERSPAIVVVTQDARLVGLQAAEAVFGVVVLVRVGQTNEDAALAEDTLNALQSELLRLWLNNPGRGSAWEALELVNTEPVASTVLDGEHYATFQHTVRLVLGEGGL